LVKALQFLLVEGIYSRLVESLHFLLVEATMVSILKLCVFFIEKNFVFYAYQGTCCNRQAYKSSESLVFLYSILFITILLLPFFCSNSIVIYVLKISLRLVIKRKELTCYVFRFLHGKKITIGYAALAPFLQPEATSLLEFLRRN
jgi:hypothetical protein